MLSTVQSGALRCRRSSIGASSSVSRGGPLRQPAVVAMREANERFRRRVHHELDEWDASPLDPSSYTSPPHRANVLSLSVSISLYLSLSLSLSLCLCLSLSFCRSAFRSPERERHISPDGTSTSCAASSSSELISQVQPY